VADRVVAGLLANGWTRIEFAAATVLVYDHMCPAQSEL
jgi:hypothetical protein